MVNPRTLLSGLIKFVLKYYTAARLFFLASCDFMITFGSFVSAIYIYKSIAHSVFNPNLVLSIILIAFFVKLIFFLIFKIYDISFQHASILYILKTSTVIFIVACVNYLIFKLTLGPVWVFVVAVLEFLFELTASILFRFFPLLYYELCSRVGEVDKNCLIYGCGETGKGLKPILGRNKIRVYGFIDDDRRNFGKIINGTRVLGSIDDIEKVLAKSKIELLICAIPSIDGKKLKLLKERCLDLNIELKTVPSLHQIFNKSIEEVASFIRGINYEDLIRRPVNRESFAGLFDSFKTKRAVVTGAGSIGSELVRQLVDFGFGEIVVFDNCELSIFNLENSLDKKSSGRVDLKLVDLKNAGHIRRALAGYKPDFVFHTAAYKHVPIVEKNICEGVFNNLLCLKNIYEVSRELGAGKFIFISSDKAVRPTNVMGMTKRLGELYVQAANGKGGMVSSSVRFGNVLGSSGSFVPKIIEQIKNNRPVTITHAEATRFFMLLSEAVLLILKASLMAKGGEIFILDMGKPIKIVDIANEIISFYGKRPGLDIRIEYTGLRPGEKLFEELVFDGVEKTSYRDGIYTAKPNELDSRDFIRDYEKIMALSSEGDDPGMMEIIKRHVTLYTNEMILHGRAAQ